MRKILFIFVFCFPAGRLEAAVGYMDVYPGARANAMGTAFASVADDPYAIFFNPAGIANFDKLEFKTGIGRRFALSGPCGEVSFAYARPVPERKTGVAGIGYFGFRQNTVGSKDVIAAGWGDKLFLPYMQKPVSWGANVRMLDVRTDSEERFGAGVDAGVLVESAYGLRTGISLTDMDIGINVPIKTLHLASSYKWRDYLFAADLRYRGRLALFFAGMEASFCRGLFKARAGKGLAIDGTSQLALGFGADMLPFIVDVAFSLPWEGFHKQAGYYEFSVGYRFGAPAFTEVFVGQAASRAEALKREIGALETRRMELNKAVATAEVNKTVLENDTLMLGQRLEDLRSRLKNLEFEMLDSQRHKDEPPKKRAVPAAAPPEKWPKSHVVAPGDTLRSIASKYYGDAGLWERIFEANTDKVSRGLPDTGSELVIPSPPAK